MKTLRQRLNTNKSRLNSHNYNLKFCGNSSFIAVKVEFNNLPAKLKQSPNYR